MIVGTRESATVNIVLVVIFTGFMVFSSSRFTGLLQEMNETIGAYIAVKTLMCLLTGALFVVMCWIFGIDFALFWGLLAFLLNYIPSVGSIIATLPLILLAAIQLHSWPRVALFAVILFSRVRVPVRSAVRFRTIALDVRSSLFSFDENTTFVP